MRNIHSSRYGSEAGMDLQPPSSPLLALPAEIIQHILSFLPPSDLLTVSLVNQALNEHSQQDTLWQPFVQEQVSGRAVPKPRNMTWKQLFQQHHPYWFLVKNKLWFADIAHTGKLLIARYDHRINAIEAYALVAERKHPVMQIWEWNPEAIIHTFQPKVQLDMVSPVIRLNENSYERIYGGRLQHEIHMDVHHEAPLASAGIHSKLMLTRPWPRDITTASTPVWPPLILPSAHRTRNDTSPSNFRHTASKPARMHELSTSTFRIRKWMEFASRPNGVSMRIGEDITTYATLPEECYTPTDRKPWQGIWCGDYAGHGCEFLLITQPDKPRPLPERAEWAMRARERGGSVSSAGSWSTAPTEAESSSSSEGDDYLFETADDLEDSVATLQGVETASDYDLLSPPDSPTARLMENAPDVQEQGDDPYHGRIEAIKLTGDPNIPRGEYTFIAPDIGPNGLIRVATEDMFKGARIVKSVGHIAARGFREDTYMTSQLILISHDRLAQYWETFGHVSFYQRVNIDDFLKV
ncbi:hypothetical protein E8E13_009884 [Curvularia kusanoi]|uniref:F-box domain-containing protein n=1 Tax=Curvularia kusanoi TaxID=90978 RepID=A0A9P4WBZ1_CURKU|nr:hypothetical protein E8E13_009884 [Curvularia kusanoi]